MTICKGRLWVPASYLTRGIIKVIFQFFLILTFIPGLNAIWVDAYGSFRSQELVDQTVMNPDFVPVLELDQADNANIMFSRSTSPTYSMYYKKWDGASWVDINGGTTGYKLMDSTYYIEAGSIKFDANGHPNVTYTQQIDNQYNFELFFMKWDGGTWVDVDGSGIESARLTNTISASGWSNVALCPMFLDSGGRPNIAYFENFDLDYIKWNGTSWTDITGSGISQIKAANAFNLDMVADSQGKPGLVFMYMGNLYYYKWSGSAWVDASGATISAAVTGKIIIQSAVYGPDQGKLAFDSQDRPMVLWTEISNVLPYPRRMNFLKWNGSEWVDGDGTGQESMQILYLPQLGIDRIAIKADSYGNPHIAWCANPDGNYAIYYMWLKNGTWVDADGTGTEGSNISILQCDNWGPSLDLDSFGNPHIAWESYDGIHYVKWIDPPGTSTATPTISPTWSVSPTITNTVTISPTFTVTPTRTTSYTATTTRTSTPLPCVCMKVAGVMAPVVTPYSLSTYMSLQKVIVPLDSATSDIEVRGISGSGFIKAGIYSDNNNQPDSLIAVSVSTTASVGWNSIRFPDTHLAKGNYWLALEYKNIVLGNTGDSSRLWMGSTYWVFPTSMPATLSGYFAMDAYMVLCPDICPSNPLEACWEGMHGTSLSGTLAVQSNLFVNTPQIKSGPDGNPGLLWPDKKGVLNYLGWNGSNWVSFGGSSGNSVIYEYGQDFSSGFSLEYLTTGEPAVVWAGNNLYPSIKYLRGKDAGWVDCTGIDINDMEVPATIYDAVENVAFSLDIDNFPWIVWDDMQSSHVISIIRWNGNSWTNADGITSGSQIISDISADSSQPYIRSDGTGLPHVVWCDAVSGISYLKWNGSEWVDADGTGKESEFISAVISNSSSKPVLALDNTGNACIAWQGWDLSHLVKSIYFIRWNGSNWVDSDGTGMESAAIYPVQGECAGLKLDIDGGGTCHISWNDSGGLEYLKLNGSTWTDIHGISKDYVNLCAGDSCLYGESSLAISGAGEVFMGWNDPNSGINAARFTCLSVWYTSTCTPTITLTRTETFTIQPTPSITQTPTISATFTMTATDDDTRTMTTTYTHSPTLTNTQTPAVSPTTGCVHPDGSFGAGGREEYMINNSSKLLACAADMSGNIITAGISYNNMDMIILKIKPDGSPDTSFNGTGYVTHNNAGGGNWYDEAKAVTTDSSGRVIAAGKSANSYSNYSMAVWRYGTTGLLDTSFNGTGYFVIKNTAGVGGDDYAVAVILDSGGKIVVAGNSTTYGGAPVVTIWRLNQNGTLDTSFNGCGFILPNIQGMPTIGTAYGASIDNNGRILVTGKKGNSMAVWRFNHNGTIDGSFNGKGYVTFENTAGVTGSLGYSVGVDMEGRVLVGGSAGLSGAQSSGYACVWRFLDNGNLDYSFNGCGYNVFNNRPYGTTPGDNFYFSNIFAGPGTQITAFGMDGASSNNTHYFINRFNSDGNADFNFNGTGVYDDYGTQNPVSVAGMLDSAGRLVIGSCVTLLSNSYFQVSRFSVTCSVPTETCTQTLTTTLTSSPTSSISATSSATMIWTGTNTITMTMTCTPTMSPTCTIAETLTQTFTITASSTVAETESPTVTATNIQTGTSTGTCTFTETITASLSITFTKTLTITKTATITVTASGTISLTPTATLSKTRTATCTPSQTVTKQSTPIVSPTATKTTSLSEYQSDSVVIYPVPSRGDMLSISIKNSLSAQTAEIDIYTVNLRLIRRFTHTINASGACNLDTKSMANGSYLAKVILKANGRVIYKATKVFMIIR